LIKKIIRGFINFAKKRGLGLQVDKLIFLYYFIKNYKSNIEFVKLNPDIALPPRYMIFESYKLNYKDYYCNGFETAEWIKNIIEKYKNLSGPIFILDWGCGPSRVVRHLPELLCSGSNIYGSDYNQKTISWNKKNISNVKFISNDIIPPLKLESNYFDVIYSISVFTHLSEKHFIPWLLELFRVLKNDGILIVTLQGIAFTSRLNEKEKINFLKGNPITHQSNIEGHRSFAAFHPIEYVKKSINNYFQLEHFIPGKIINDSPQQDTWILRKIA